MGVLGTIRLDRESDGDVPETDFGNITVEDTGNGEVSIDIDLVGILDGADIHQFGFESLYDGPLLIDSPYFGVTQNGKVAGLGSFRWDYVVSFGNGKPKLDPVMFKLTGDSTFDAADILYSQPQMIRGRLEQVAVHVQSTATPSGSETILGNHCPPDNSTVPEPASAIAFAALAACSLIARRRRR